MNRRSFQIYYFIFIFGSLTAFFPFCAMKLTHSVVISTLISIACILLFSHLLLEKALNYKVCFLYTTLSIILTSALFLLTYKSKEIFLSHYSNINHYFLISTWFASMIYCIFRNVHDRGPKFLGFKRYFLKMSFVFGLFFMGMFLYLMLVHPLPYLQPTNNFHNFIPFLTIATYIETYIYDHSTGSLLLSYFLPSIFLYHPFGFYTQVLFKHFSLFVRMFVIILVPLTIEILQLFLQVQSATVDDVLLALIGSATGFLFYNILNALYLHKADEDFLHEHIGYSFSRRF